MDRVPMLAVLAILAAIPVTIYAVTRATTERAGNDTATLRLRCGDCLI